MATSLGVGDVVKMRVWANTASGGGQASVNTIWYTVAAAGSPAATDQDAADTMDALIALPLRALLSAGANYRGVQAQIYNGALPYRAFSIAANAIAGAGVGLVAGVIMPTQVSGLISFGTTRAGRQFRGRFYVPFPGQADDSGGGSPTVGYGTRLVTLGGIVGVGLALSTAGRTATLVRVIVHGQPKVGAIPMPTPVIAYYAGPGWATQRRRGDYGRLNRSPL